MDVQGIDALRARLGANSAVLNSEMKSAEKESLDAIRDKARSLAPGNKLPNSVQRELDAGGLTGRIGSVARTAYSIEKGRPETIGGSNKWPSLELVQSWLVRKGIGIGVAQSTKTHRTLKPRKNSPAAQALHDQAARVIYAMKQRGGTSPQPFIVPAARLEADDVQRIFQRHVQKVLQKLANV